jgi:hypothetical protein
MRKPRDFDAELKALGDKTRDLKSRKIQQLGELVIATGADALNANELAGALPRRKRPERGRHGPNAGPRSFKAGRGEMHRQMTATQTALLRNRAVCNRYQAAKGRHDMRMWQVERRKRTRHLIELGGLVLKAGIVELTGDDRAIILGALLWIADKLQSGQREQARTLWAAKGKEAFAVERATDGSTISRETPPDRA